MSWSTAASSCRAAARSCWPTPKYAAPTSAPERGRGVIAGAPPRQGFSYTQTGIFSNRRSTRPGCEGVLVRLPFAPRAVLLHPNRVRTEGGAPTSKSGFSYTKTGFFSNRRCTRPGCEGALARLPFAPRAVLLHLDRDSPASKPGFFSNRRSTRAGCEGALARLPFAPRAVLLHLDRDSATSKRDSSRTVGAPAPGAKVLDRGSGGQSASGAPP